MSQLNEYSSESTSLQDHFVHLNYRYTAAWSEINMRIAQRQNALQIYITLSSGLLAVLFSGGDSSHSSGSSGSEIALLAYKPQLICFLLPVVSLVFGFLNYKHERTIAILRGFLTRCEIINNSDKSPDYLTGYHCDDKGYRAAKAVRTWHDIASILLIVLFNVIGSLLALVSLPPTIWPTFFVTAVFLAVAACALVGMGSATE